MSDNKYCLCGGVFKPTGIVLTSCPPQIQHQCDKCSKIKAFYETNRKTKKSNHTACFGSVS